MILTFLFFGAAFKTLTLCNLGTEGSLLADTGKIRKATAVRRRTIALRCTFLLLGNISLVTSEHYQQLVMETYSTRWPVSEIRRLSRGISSQQWGCTEREHEEYLKHHVGC